MPNVEPEIEKVRGGRRAAIAVLASAVVVVGALIWKPWDAPSGAPQTTAVAILPAQSLAVTATPFAFEPTTATPAPVQVVPGEAPHPIEQPQPTPSDEHFAAVLLASKGPYVRCTYGVAKDGREQLEALLVPAPIVTFGHGGKSDFVRTIVFRPELESNRLQGIFSEEWHFVRAARAQRWPLSRGPSIQFASVRLKPARDELSDVGVFRISVVVNWIGDGGEVLESQRVYPVGYSLAGSPESTPGGCPANIERDRPIAN